jgi:branched-subunit amino acid aminotransferase/4-amino-4-deoxychorismate lyase
MSDRITDYESVFMTGTSPMVLPFRCIDDKNFKVRVPLIEKLRKLYMLRAEESKNSFRIVKNG